MDKKALLVAGVLFLVLAIVIVVGGGGAGLYFWLSEEDDTLTTAEVRLPETTKILSQSSLQHLLSVSEDGATLTFGAEAAQAKSLSQGDVIACDVTEQTPYGLLRKVTEVEEGDNQIVVNTTDATLEDAIEEGTIEAKCSLASDEDGSDAVLKTTIDEVLYEDEAGNQIRVTGELKCDAVLDLDAEISGAQLRRLDLGIAMDETTKLRIEGGVSLDDFSSAPVEVLRKELPTITVRAGDLPIPITPVLRVSVGCEGAIVKGMTVDVTQKTSADMGVQYEKGDWAAVKKLGEPSFDWGEPSVPANCRAKAYVQRELDFELYGEAGPNAKTVGYAEVRADSSNWELDGGIEGDVGLRTKMIADKDDYTAAAVVDRTDKLADGTVKTFIVERDITGTVKDSADNPLEEVTVEVYDANGLVDSGTTGSDGTYLIGPVPVGSGYRVEFSKTTYVTVKKTNVTVDVVYGATVDAVLEKALADVQGKVTDATTDDPLEGVTIKVYDANGLVDSGTTGSDGTYLISSVPAGSGYRVEFSMTGYVTEEETDVTVDADDGATVNAALEAALGDIQGHVRSATTNEDLEDVTVEVHDSDGLVASGTTGSDGRYLIDSIPAGSGYRIEFSMLGYITVEETGVAVDAVAGATVDAVMSPILSVGETRIVLTWGATPTDLDSYLTGPLSDDSTFWVYWLEPSAGTEGVDRVELDVDDVTSYGPETITILNQVDGVYQYLVHDFDNWGYDPSTGLANSQAQVNVYQGSELVATFDVPNQGGTLWTVFQLDGDTITSINTMSYDDPAPWL